MITEKDRRHVQKLGNDLKQVIASIYGSGVKRVMGYELNEGTDALEGVFEGKDGFYQFELTSRNILSYEQIRYKAPLDRLDDPFWQGFVRNDGPQVKKNCVESIPCGEGCIPYGTICHQGVPTAQQARVMAVRAALKMSRKLARAAAAVAVTAGITALSVYAMRKAHDAKLGERVQRAAESMGMSQEGIHKLRSFASDVAARMKAPDPLVSAMKPDTKAIEAKHFQSLSLPEKISKKAGDAIQAYTKAWQEAPVATATAHISTGLLLYGTTERVVGPEKMARKRAEVGTFVKSKLKRKDRRIKSRKTSYGA